jgi:hypothetical protein
MISFEDDVVWPSATMCDTMLAKMAAEKEKNDRRKIRKEQFNLLINLEQ